MKNHKSFILSKIHIFWKFHQYILMILDKLILAIRVRM